MMGLHRGHYWLSLLWSRDNDTSKNADRFYKDEVWETKSWRLSFTPGTMDITSKIFETV